MKKWKLVITYINNSKKYIYFKKYINAFGSFCSYHKRWYIKSVELIEVNYER